MSSPWAAWAPRSTEADLELDRRQGQGAIPDRNSQKLGNGLPIHQAGRCAPSLGGTSSPWSRTRQGLFSFSTALWAWDQGIGSIRLRIEAVTIFKTGLCVKRLQIGTADADHGARIAQRISRSVPPGPVEAPSQDPILVYLQVLNLVGMDIRSSRRVLAGHGPGGVDRLPLDFESPFVKA